MNVTQGGSTPPTPKPTKDDGPWFNEMDGRWWVVADGPAEAINVVKSCDPDMFPNYFGWTAQIKPCLIRWAPDYNGDEVCIDEVSVYDDEDTVAEAWRITVEGL